MSRKRKIPLNKFDLTVPEEYDKADTIVSDIQRACGKAIISTCTVHSKKYAAAVTLRNSLKGFAKLKGIKINA